jgi:putative DNA primase/helicase
VEAREVAAALGGKRSGRQFVACCPAHEDRMPSLIIFDGHTDVQVRCLAGCDPRDVLAALRRRGIMEYQGADHEGGSTRDRSRKQKPAALTHVSRETILHRRLAGAIWRDAHDARGTMVEDYLASRRLALPPEHDEVIRFVPQCPREHGAQPALVALFRDVETDRPCAVQRIFLTPDARKDGAQMLGPVGNAAMKLTSKRATFSGDLGTCARLAVCEGLETGLALIREGLAPVWALGSAGAMRVLPVLFGVDAILCCADHDREVPMGNRMVRPGIDAAQECVARWSEAKRDAAWCTPAREGTDFADDLDAVRAA